MLAVAAIGIGAAACVPSRFSKEQVRDRWVSTYVEQLGITETQAACIVDAWFAEISDDELRPLTKGKELSEAQATRIGELAVDCGVGSAGAA